MSTALRLHRPDKTKEKIDALGTSLHTALRKMCDSPASSLVYNVISITRDPGGEGWKAYLELVLPEWSKARTQKAAAKILSKAAQELEFGTPQRNAIKLSMVHMESDDWDGMAAYFSEWKKIVKDL